MLALPYRARYYGAMLIRGQELLIRALRWSERYTKTDMVYLASTGWWSNAGTLIITVCSLLLYILFANVLPIRVYGTYQYLLSVAAIIQACTLTGMSSSVARSVARGYDGSLREAVRAQFVWGVVPALLALAASAYYAWNDNMLLAGGLVLIALFTPLNAALGIYGAYWQGKRDFKRGFLYGMGWNLPYYAALALTAYYAPVVLALLAANLLSQFVALAYFHRKTTRTIPADAPADPETVPYGKHLSLINFLNVVALQVDTVLAFQFIGAVELAIYNYATAIPERAGGFLKFFQTAALPKLATKSPEEIRKAFGARIWIAIAGAAVAALAYAVLAPYMFKFLFPAYMAAVPYSQLYALTIIASLAGLFSTGLVASRRIQDLYILNIASPLVQIALQLAGILFYGLWGLLIGRLLSNFISIVLSAGLLLLRK